MVLGGSEAMSGDELLPSFWFGPFFRKYWLEWFKPLQTVTNAHQFCFLFGREGFSGLLVRQGAFRSCWLDGFPCLFHVRGKAYSVAGVVPFW